MRRRLQILLLLSAALIAGGCGSSSDSSTGVRSATLVLDFTPNAIHSGIYAALSRGYLRKAGVDLKVVAPPASPDSVKLLESGRANFAILDIHDLALARAEHQPIVAIMAIVEHPLAAVVASATIRNPKQLEGTTVGVTGDPSDLAVLHSIVRGAGGDPSKLKTVTIGFNAVAALVGERVSAATAFWNDEGVTLSHDHDGFHSFRVDAYGAPPYPELLLCATRATVRRDPKLARSVVHALVRGYQYTLKNPEGSETDLEEQVQGLDPRLVAEQLTAELPAFPGPGHVIGELNHAVLSRWATWEEAFGIVKRRPDIDAMFDPEFLPKN